MSAHELADVTDSILGKLTSCERFWAGKDERVGVGVTGSESGAGDTRSNTLSMSSLYRCSNPFHQASTSVMVLGMKDPPCPSQMLSSVVPASLAQATKR